MTQYLGATDRVNRTALDYPGSVETVEWAPALHATLDLPRGRVGEPYRARVLVSGGTPPWHVTFNRIPQASGLVFDSIRGEIVGTPLRPIDWDAMIVVVSDATRGTNTVIRGLRLQIEP